MMTSALRRLPIRAHSERRQTLVDAHESVFCQTGTRAGWAIVVKFIGAERGICRLIIESEARAAASAIASEEKEDFSYGNTVLRVLAIDRLVPRSSRAQAQGFAIRGNPDRH